ncbi:Eisosome component PIL1/LSP1, partial [Dipodascopsis uninucleata]
HRALSLRSRNQSDDGPMSPLSPSSLSPRKTFFPSILTSPIQQNPLSRLLRSISPLGSRYRSAGLATMSTAQLLSLWGDETGDLAVSDVSDKFGVLLAELAALEDSYAEGIDHSKRILKTIKDVESSIRPALAHQTKLRDQIARAVTKKPTPDAYDRLEQLERELVRADAEVLVADAQLTNVTRDRLQASLRAQIDALQERCEKELVLVRYGRQLLDLLNGEMVVPGQGRAPYLGEEQSRQILARVDRDLRAWS